eukprot:TRINITY_DN6634_c0_g2_i1.p1 TRINITY_DN6634_c0_g2~~TRINITY_DN6634_c0_g2_i1.p1  ORF type:complete len:1202 (+),score=257.36 TRINITY_DN6634_c0_g2_i1:61-3666(+)
MTDILDDWDGDEDSDHELPRVEAFSAPKVVPKVASTFTTKRPITPPMKTHAYRSNLAQPKASHTLSYSSPMSLFHPDDETAKAHPDILQDFDEPDDEDNYDGYDKHQHDGDQDDGYDNTDGDQHQDEHQDQEYGDDYQADGRQSTHPYANRPPQHVVSYSNGANGDEDDEDEDRQPIISQPSSKTHSRSNSIVHSASNDRLVRAAAASTHPVVREIDEEDSDLEEVRLDDHEAQQTHHKPHHSNRNQVAESSTSKPPRHTDQARLDSHSERDQWRAHEESNKAYRGNQRHDDYDHDWDEDDDHPDVSGKKPRAATSSWASQKTSGPSNTSQQGDKRPTSRHSRRPSIQIQPPDSDSDPEDTSTQPTRENTRHQEKHTPDSYADSKKPASRHSYNGSDEKDRSYAGKDGWDQPRREGSGTGTRNLSEKHPDRPASANKPHRKGGDVASAYVDTLERDDETPPRRSTNTKESPYDSATRSDDRSGRHKSDSDGHKRRGSVHRRFESPDDHSNWDSDHDTQQDSRPQQKGEHQDARSHSRHRSLNRHEARTNLLIEEPSRQDSTLSSNYHRSSSKDERLVKGNSSSNSRNARRDLDDSENSDDHRPVTNSRHRKERPSRKSDEEEDDHQGSLKPQIAKTRSTITTSKKYGVDPDHEDPEANTYLPQRSKKPIHKKHDMQHQDDGFQKDDGESDGYEIRHRGKTNSEKKTRSKGMEDQIFDVDEDATPVRKKSTRKKKSEGKSLDDVSNIDPSADKPRKSKSKSKPKDADQDHDAEPVSKSQPSENPSYDQETDQSPKRFVPPEIAALKASSIASIPPAKNPPDAPLMSNTDQRYDGSKSAPTLGSAKIHHPDDDSKQLEDSDEAISSGMASSERKLKKSSSLSKLKKYVQNKFHHQDHSTETTPKKDISEPDAKHEPIHNQVVLDSKKKKAAPAHPIAEDSSSKDEHSKHQSSSGKHLRMSGSFSKLKDKLKKPKVPVTGPGPLFGGKLEDSPTFSELNPTLPLFVERAVEYLSVEGTKAEGIFRVSGSQVKIAEWKAKAEKKFGAVKFYKLNDPHAAAGLLKQYLRELKEPLVPQMCHSAFISSAEAFERDSQDINFVSTICAYASSWSKIRKAVFCAVFQMLLKLSLQASATKMDASNLATVLGPSLFCPSSSFSGSDGGDKLELAMEASKAMAANMKVYCMISSILAFLFFVPFVSFVCLP